MNFKLLFAILIIAANCFGQEPGESKKYTLDANQFYGSIILHNPDISHLITEHPAGVILSYNRKTYGLESWEEAYNYPDLGYSFIYQNSNNSTLGDNYGLYAHYNFYLFRRNMQLRIGQGISYATNPYDKVINFRNNAYGSDILSSTYLMFNFHKENIVKGLGFKAGVSIIHYSNANFRAPNTSTNTLALNAGFVYDLDGGKEIEYIHREKEKITEPVRYNLALRTGLNESDVIDSGQYGFVVLSAYADKRLSRKSALQLGTDVYFSSFLKELIRYQSIAFPENGVNADDDYKRVGVFAGHELFINKMSVISQFGYYVYYPFDFEGRTYLRMGLKRYFGDKIFGAVTLKSHGAKAEAVEFGIGIRL
ncbi:acyloxyacyl hydrolase [Maribacter sp.]|uniref:acyloxyacyl hydrolase n=1 Tax=Maribacter sp. TaxID=1897614 RepID=UPI003297C397